MSHQHTAALIYYAKQPIRAISFTSAYPTLTRHVTPSDMKRRERQQLTVDLVRKAVGKHASGDI